MTKSNGCPTKPRRKLEVRPIDPVTMIPREQSEYVCVLTIPDPENPSRRITNVVCRYNLGGGEVRFKKNPINSDESFEDALRWAKAFAGAHGIATIYAGNFSGYIPGSLIKATLCE